MIPAIDLLDGNLVRLYQGNFKKVTVYDSKPYRQARNFLKAGAKFLHVVDLNAARKAESRENDAAIAEIVNAVGKDMEIELGGGIRDWERLKKSFALGVQRCVIGTAAVKDPAFLQRALEHYGGKKIIVGVDVYKGFVHISGWEEKSSLKASELIANLERLGLEEVIFTDISRDGALEGPGDALRGLS